MSRENKVFEKLVKIKYKTDRMNLYNYVSATLIQGNNILSNKIASDYVKLTEAILAFIKFNLLTERLIKLNNSSDNDRMQIEFYLSSDKNEQLEGTLSDLSEKLEHVQTSDEAINIFYEYVSVFDQLEAILHKFKDALDKNN